MYEVHKKANTKKKIKNCATGEENFYKTSENGLI